MTISARHPSTPLDAGSPRRPRLAPRRWGLGVVLVAALAVALAAGLAACGGSDGGGDGPAALAQVNGVPVTQGQVDDVRAEGRLAGDEKDAAAALEEAILREVLRQEAERLGVAVDEAAIDARVADVAERLGGDEALAQALETAAMSPEQLRRGAEHGLLREAVRERRFDDLTVTDAAVRSFYREHRDDLFTEPAAVRLSSILVRVEDVADEVLAKLAEGAAFAELARIYSRDAESKDDGGMLGWITEASLPAPLAAAARELQRGEISDPVGGPGGWYVLKLHDRRAATTRPFAAVEDGLRAELDLRKQVRALDAWIAAARERASVEYSTP
jgi:parvulin-like peptidyl-prolyl isomerase